MAAITICSDLEPKKIKSDTVSTVSPSVSHEVLGPDVMIFVFRKYLCSINHVLRFFQWSYMDVRVGLGRKLSAEELLLLNCGVGEDS